MDTRDYSVADDVTDTVLIVEEEELHVVKALLIMQSPVFKAMFENNFKEKNESKVPLPGKKVTEVKWMLDYFYPNTDLDITDEMAVKLYPLADEFQIEGLKQRCINVMMKLQNPRLEIVALAYKYGLSSLLQTALNYCAANLPVSRSTSNTFTTQYSETKPLPQHTDEQPQEMGLGSQREAGFSFGFGSSIKQKSMNNNLNPFGRLQFKKVSQGYEKYLKPVAPLGNSIDSELELEENADLPKECLIQIYRKKIDFAKIKFEEVGVNCDWL